MKTILFAQSSSPTEKSTIVIDGQVFEFDSHDDKLQNAFSYLVGCDDWEEVKVPNYYRRKFSSQFQINQSDEGTFVKSNYVTEDIGGRKMMFMFYSRTTDYNLFCDELEKQSSILNRELEPEEVIYLRKQKKSPKVYLGILAIVVILLGILLIGLNRTNNNDNDKPCNNDTINNDTIRVINTR